MRLRRRYTIGELMLVVAVSAVLLAILSAFGSMAAVLAGAIASTLLAFVGPIALVSRLRPRIGADRVRNAALSLAMLALSLDVGFYAGLAVVPAPRWGIMREIVAFAMPGVGYLAFVMAAVAIGLEWEPPFSAMATVLSMLVLLTTFPFVLIGGMGVYLILVATGVMPG